MELLVGMVLTAIISVIAFSSYTLIQGQFFQLQKTQNIANDYQEFRMVLKEDFRKAIWIKKTTHQLLLNREDGLLYYDIEEKILIRHHSKTPSVRDTLMLPSQVLTCFKKGTPVEEGLIDNLVIELTVFEEAQRLSIDLTKYKTSTKSDSIVTTKESSSLLDFLNKDIKLFGDQLSMKKKEAFYAELEVLLKAGLDLRTALDLIKVSLKKEEAIFLEATKKFSNYEIFSIQIAEESGKLPPVLKDLNIYFTKSLQYKRMLISAMSYPLLVIFVAIMALIFLLSFLVPLFGDIYARLDHELPTITTMVVNLSDYVQRLTVPTIITLLISAVFLYTQRKKIWFRKWSALIIIKIPIFGDLAKKIYLARFTQAMSFLLQSKVPMLSAIDLVKKMVSFYPIEYSLDNIQSEILKGKALHTCLNEYSIYPTRMISLIKVGEEANQLENMFAKISSQYNDEVEQKTKMLGSLIEPILIVFLAVVVGLVLVSMYLPIFKLVTNF